jgi:hypothetical protein
MLPVGVKSPRAKSANSSEAVKKPISCPEFNRKTKHSFLFVGKAKQFFSAADFSELDWIRIY